MSDGPHKSLPMKRHWKKFAERLARPAYSAAEVCELLPVALKQDFQEAPVDAVSKILEGGKQKSLFADERIEQLETLKQNHRGSVVSDTLIECALVAVGKGLSGESAISSALENALEGHVGGALRSLEEHFLRKASTADAQYVQNRLVEIRHQFDFKSIVKQLNSTSETVHIVSEGKRQSGLDDGPQL